MRRLGLLLGRIAGAMLAAGGIGAGFLLYGEFIAWTEPLATRLALLIPTGGAVAFAVIQGGRMARAKTRTELSFTPGVRFLAVATILSELVLGLELYLPEVASRGPVATLGVIVQAALLFGGLVPLARGPGGGHRDGA